MSALRRTLETAELHHRADELVRPSPAGGEVTAPFAGVLELLPEAAAVVDEACRVIASNAAFRGSPRRRLALPTGDGTLHAAHAAADVRLAERIESVLRGRGERVLRIPVPGESEALEVRIVPLAGAGAGARGGVMPRAVVIVHDPSCTRAVCVARLRELYGLTRAEADVAAHLAAGASLECAATLLRVSLSTVRTHLRHLFVKCGVSTQAALLQRLALSAARVGGVGAVDAPHEFGLAARRRSELRTRATTAPV